MNYVQLALWSFAAGAFIPVVGILNSGLARTVGGPAPATLILISVAWIGMIIAILVSRTALQLRLFWVTSDRISTVAG
jgi:uncharacterized membrane protein YdcZ (DUF606 family)